MYSFLSENRSSNFILLNWGQGVAIDKIMRSTSCAHIIVLGIGYVHKNKSSAAVAHLQIRGLIFFTSSSDDSIVIRFLMAENCSSYLSFPFTDVDLTSGRRVLAESASGHGQSAINMRIVRFVICKKCKRVFERRPMYGPAADGEKWKYNTEIRRDGISYLVYYNDVRYFVRWKCIICDYKSFFLFFVRERICRTIRNTHYQRGCCPTPMRVVVLMILIKKTWCRVVLDGSC